MTKTLSIAALFFAASVAATAALHQQPIPPAQAMASEADTAAEVTRRGSRDLPRPVGTATAMIDAGDQPRRGQRPALEAADNSLPALALEAERRGSR
ncbi:hypothetical protein CKO31_15525 [Thiohalocapsa halophila]|uniref:DUF4148 domain-containing protein n=1 Tax=Thiohalocapsa halophila TaxID=69359 RepID=A0ABS1CJL7_9GAMM|nr:hypothetical protein [Thiohalocapsa halophila]MBK1632120.1 hypothetical protein [Thiohalocapsa halophila]